MAEFVSDCPRCGAKRATLDVFGSIIVSIEYQWKHYAEIHCICRTCHRSSLQLVTRKNIDEATKKYFGQTGTRNTLAEYRGSLNDMVDFVRNITLRDVSQEDVPEHLPLEIAKVISEGNLCLSVGCFNASAAMYRLALDLSTKRLIPALTENEPSAHVRKNLAPRVEWLLINNIIPGDLKSLATAVRENGNDGAHDGTLSKSDAEDVKDFCIELVRRLYTEPERIRLAEERRAIRKTPLG